MGFHYIPPADAAKSIATGSYAGDDSADRQIATGFKCSMVVIIEKTVGKICFILIPSATIVLQGGTANFLDSTSTLYIHATDGFQVGTGAADANASGSTYYWWAISE